MGTLKLCRICLVENVRMFIVTDIHLQGVFEKLTNIPFMTEDCRPMLVCFFCYARLKQCHHFMMKCLEAEKLFAQMLNEDYEQNHIQVRDNHEFLGGFIKTQMENIDIVDGEPQVVSVKEELPVDDETGYVDFIEEDDSDGTPVAEKPKQHVQKEKCEATISTKQKKTGQVNTKANKSVPKMKVPIISNSISKAKVNNSIINKEPINIKCTTIDINLCNGIHKEDLTCKICDYIAISSHDIKRHNSLHSNVKIKDKPYRCDICQSSFNLICNLKIHMRIHTGEKPYKCDICQRRFRENGSLKKHTRTHTGEKPYKCDICQSSFNEMSKLKMHTRTHTGEKPYKCDICQRSFSSNGSLKRHTRTHIEEKPYKCDKCQSSFNQIGNFKRHMRIHTGAKLYNCDICKKGFRKLYHFKNHMHTHTGEKPFKCDICQCSFNKIYTLKMHMRTHTGEKPYKCDICQRSFSVNDSLKKHKLTHTREKPYKCDICQRSYSQNHSLKTHIRTHILEKPYKCDICQSSFNQICTHGYTSS